MNDAGADAGRWRPGGERGRVRRRGGRGGGGALLCALACALAGPVSADDGAGDVWEALTRGKPVLDVRGRIEIAESDAFERSEAYTVRTRLGYGTRPYHGVRVYMDFENVASATLDTYFYPNRLPNAKRQTAIADGPVTQVNQGFLEIDRPDWLGTRVVGGRQRIVFDDHRFVGDVDWRQNQQTFDAAYAQTSLGVDGLTARYGYIGRVHRIFGGGGNNPVASDFDSQSQVVNVSYTRFAQANLVGFAYLLDLTLPYVALPLDATNSSKTFGLRLAGAFDLGERLELRYTASYANQSQYGRFETTYPGTSLPVTDYDADYYLGELSLGWSGLGRVGGGYEELGSDAGVKQFLTPLATLHKFNGFADVFLDNGGRGGLRDFYVYAMPELPWKLKLNLVYHRFWADSGGALFGNEFDAVLSRRVNEHVLLLFKSAYFDQADGAPRPSVYRLWFDVTISF